MEILKKIIITNNKRPILLHTESRNDNSSSKINQTCKTNYNNNININNKSSYVNIQNSKIKLMKNIPKSKLNISFCKKGINNSNTNNNEPNKECKLITYIDLGNNKIKKYLKTKKDISQDSKPIYSFKKDFIINNNITNNISNHITNIILTNNNNQKSNRVNNKSYLSNKNDETNNNLSQRLQNKRRIIKYNKLEKHIYNKIDDSKIDLTSRNTKNIDKVIDIKTNSIKVGIKNLKSKEKGKENKTNILSDRNKNNMSTYFTSYINYSSNLNNNINNKNNSNIPINNKNIKSLVKYKNETTNIELNINTKKLKQNSFKKLKSYNSFNSYNSKGKLIKSNPSMKFLEDSLSMKNPLSSNRNKIPDTDKINHNNNFNLNNKINKNNKYSISKKQKQYKNELNINIKDLKHLNQMRSLFVSRITNSNTKNNKSLGDKNLHNISYINSSVTFRDNKKPNNFKEINYTLISSNSKPKKDSKNKYKDANLFIYKNKIKNKNDLISNIYKNYKTERSIVNTNYTNNTFTNDESSNINIINIINNFNQKNTSYNKSFLSNNFDKNQTVKGQKRKISLNVYKNIKKYFLSKSLQKNFDISNTYINYKNDNYNSYKEQYLYNKANSYRNISYISKEKDKKNYNYTKRKNPKYYSNQKKIHNKKININKKKNRLKKEKNIEYAEFNMQKNDIMNIINLKNNNNKINIIKNKLLKRNPKNIHTFSKDGHIIVNRRKNENRNINEINYSRETYNSISINALKNIFNMESNHFSPKPCITKNNLIKNYNINIRNIQGGGIVKQNKSFKISNPYNNINIISLNKKKKIKIEDIIHNKYKNKKYYNYRNNFVEKLSKENKTNFNKKPENKENKLINKENEIISKSKDTKDKITHTKYFRKSKTSQNNISNPNLFELSFNKEIKKEKIEFENEQSIINPEIKNNPQYLSEYLYDILENFLLDESLYISKNYIKPNYLYYFNDTELTEEIRTVSINWLIMIIYKIFKFKENTLFLTVQIIDRFLSKKMLSVEKTELLILCSLILSSKHEEIDYVNMVESLQLSTNKFTKEEIINMQYEILNELNFELIIPTMNDYYNIYCTILNLDEIDINKGMFLLNIILVDYNIIKYPNFIISLAAVKLIYKKSINSLIKRLKYYFIKNKQDKFLDIINNEKILDKVCYKIKKIYKKYLEDKSKNIEEKFSDEKYKSVAKFSDELIDISDIL